ncbi:MAG: hypothetical protein S4CHLAM102_06530 [Chlamydiia bacterium]|nr:hypothetical protein [Chlamydiia bacterium]
MKITYIIDGFNLLFATDLDYPDKEAFALQVDQYLHSINANGLIIYDDRKNLGQSHPSKQHLKASELVYTPQGMCADSYILEWLNAHPKAPIVLVSSDKRLITFARELGARSITSQAFISKVQKEAKNHTSDKQKPSHSTPSEIEYWQKLFEDRMDDK